jgi:hypothetical protein
MRGIYHGSTRARPAEAAWATFLSVSSAAFHVPRRSPRLLAFALAWLGCALPSGALAQSVDAFDGDATARWVAQRVAAARRGQADLVEIPIAQASTGWGCTCPSTYVGTDPDSAGAAWLDVAGSAVGLPEAGPRGRVVVARGYFSGNHETFEGDGDMRYRVFEFVVTELVRERAPDEPRARVVSDDAFVCTSVVSDTTPLHVRARAALRADVVGDIEPGGAVTIEEARPDWLRLTAPVAGWVWAANVATRCVPAPTEPPSPSSR